MYRDLMSMAFENPNGSAPRNRWKYTWVNDQSNDNGYATNTGLENFATRRTPEANNVSAACGWAPLSYSLAWSMPCSPSQRRVAGYGVASTSGLSHTENSVLAGLRRTNWRPGSRPRTQAPIWSNEFGPGTGPSVSTSTLIYTSGIEHLLDPADVG